MNNNEYDEDLFDLYTKLLDEEEEIDLLKKIMNGVDGDKIIDEFLKSLGDKKND